MHHSIIRIRMTFLYYLLHHVIPERKRHGFQYPLMTKVKLFFEISGKENNQIACVWLKRLTDSAMPCFMQLFLSESPNVIINAVWVIMTPVIQVIQASNVYIGTLFMLASLSPLLYLGLPFILSPSTPSKTIINNTACCQPSGGTYKKTKAHLLYLR